MQRYTSKFNYFPWKFSLNHCHYQNIKFKNNVQFQMEELHHYLHLFQLCKNFVVTWLLIPTFPNISHVFLQTNQKVLQSISLKPAKTLHWEIVNQLRKLFPGFLSVNLWELLHLLQKQNHIIMEWFPLTSFQNAPFIAWVSLEK